jgi:hypothetical protein
MPAQAGIHDVLLLQSAVDGGSAANMTLLGQPKRQPKRPLV